jgi:formylglycine-generating enzyme required for sulfatase activity
MLGNIYEWCWDLYDEKNMVSIAFFVVEVGLENLKIVVQQAVVVDIHRFG